MNATPRRRTKIHVENDLARMAAGTADPRPDRQPPAGADAPATAPAAAPTVNTHNPDAKEGEEYPGEPTIKIGTARVRSLDRKCEHKRKPSSFSRLRLTTIKSQSVIDARSSAAIPDVTLKTLCWSLVKAC